MKSLTLLRHAKSDWVDPAMADVDRPLNARGRAAARTIGRALRDRGDSFDLILTSPAVRTLETLAGISEAYGSALAAMRDQRIYLASCASLLAIVRATADEIGRLLILGHNPGLEQLALLLGRDGDLRDRLLGKFPTGGMVEIEFAVECWDQVGEASGTIKRFVVPRDLAGID